MGKKQGKGKSEEAAEKAITGSGAEPQPEPNGDDYVKCVCTVCCADKGYHDVGDKVWIRRELLENDAFIRTHFKAVEPLPEGQRRQDGGEGEGQGEGQSEGEGEGQGEGEGEGQGELDLK